jgi:hypothetical protein
MARTLNRLTAREVATATQPGMYPDGAGLYLRVASGKSWVLRYMLDGKAREMGLGGLAKVGLADARKKAAEKRLLLADKIDPIERRKAVRGEKKIEATRTVTFDDSLPPISKLTSLAGVIPSIINNGQIRSPDMSPQRLAACRWARSTSGW